MTQLRGPHRAELVRVETTVVLPDSFPGPVRVWPRVGGTFTVRAGFRLPYWAPWCEVSEVGDRRFTLRGYLYRVLDADLPQGVTDAWLPVPPDQARLGFTVIGRVERAPALDVAPPVPGARAAALIAMPNPFRDGVRLIGPRAVSAITRVTITDVAGRVVARVSPEPVGGEAVWDGRDARGRPVPAGLYLARVDTGGRILRCRMVKLDGRP
jgi:hypothetical protein